MKKHKIHQPPVIARRFLHGYCRTNLLEDLEGDLNEYFTRNVKSKGLRMAQFIYILDVLKFFRLYTIKKPQPSKAMNDLIVLRSYFKTSFRNIARNRIFSSINIVGLAISMSIGLLLITLIVELKSFDAFHAKAERIFRIDNRLQHADGGVYNYASTSILSGRKIKESVPGIDEVSIIGKGFDKDVIYGDKVIPLKGFWADDAFFDIFSFELLSGDAATALKNPNTVVLTAASAIKLFGNTDVTGKLVQIDTVNYMVSGVVKDPPLNSHMRFDMLGSFITIDQANNKPANNWMKWDNMWNNYVYVLLSEQNNRTLLEQNLARISDEGNRTIENNKITLYAEPLREIVLGRNMSNSIGPTIDKSVIVTLSILTLVVVISACFNYTNLSIARALRRTREVGIRKVVGASRRHVFAQFIFESIMLSTLSLIIAYGLLLLIRQQFLLLDKGFQDMVTLEPGPLTFLYFMAFAIFVGVLAGLLPASFFSRIDAARILKDFSSVKLLGHISLRKTLIIFQYTLSILFIVMVSMGYKQYRYALNFDLGFETQNIFTMALMGNRPSALIKEMSELPELDHISFSHHLSSVGSNTTGNVRYNDVSDSSVIYFNFVDGEYLPLHEHTLLAGENFKAGLSPYENRHQIIINQQTLKWMQLADPHQAIGEELTIDGQKNKIIGVVADFHYERVNYPIRNFAFRCDPEKFEVASFKMVSGDVLATIDKIREVWKKLDKVHPFDGKFYQDHIENAYEKLSWSIKIFGFIAFIIISIASLGLLGMVIFTTEKRVKEMSIRKVLGASEGNLMVLMSRGFLALLFVSAAIALPCGYYVMDRIILGRIVYRAPVYFLDLATGVFIVMGLAILMIGVQTVKIARTNPAETLKNE